MQAALHIRTRVLPGNKIEISNTQLREGDPVELFLILPQPAGETRPSALDVIASLKGHRLFQSPEEVDQHLQEERDSWER